MKTYKRVLSAVLLMSIMALGCAKKASTTAADGTTTDDTTLTSSFFIGTWISECYLDSQSGNYSVLTISFQENLGFLTLAQSWDSSNSTCSGAASSTTSISGTLVFGSLVEGTTDTIEYDITITSPFSMNLYSILKKTSSNTMSVGEQASSGDDGFTAEKRHTGVGTVTFTKVEAI